MGGWGHYDRGLLFVIALLASAVTAAVLIPVGGPSAEATGGQPAPEELNLVPVRENSSTLLWPYTSRRQSFDTATLPINVVVEDDVSFVRFLLTASPHATWNVTDEPTGVDDAQVTRNGSTGEPESGVILNGTAIEWTSAPGSTRYTFVYDESEEEGRWLAETYQLHDGDYLGTRYHVRLYGDPSGTTGWTAIQAHREHWDWFRLRHTVDSVGQAQSYVENEFYEAWFTRAVDRERFANGGALDSDGWVTVVRLADVGPPTTLLPMLVGFGGLMLGFTSARSLARTQTNGERSVIERSSSLRYLALFALLAALPLAVRGGSIWVEQAIPDTTPKAVAAAFYPVLVGGPPAIAVLLSRDLEPARSAGTAVIGFGVGLLADYFYLHVTVLPIQVIAHRGMLLSVVGLLAAVGSLRTRQDTIQIRLLVVGLLAWISMLGLPLVGVV